MNVSLNVSIPWSATSPRRLIVAHNYPTTTFSRKLQFKHVQQASSYYKICRVVFVCQSCTTECCSRAFFIKELSNLSVHARICDHILINISHVASVISSFRSPSNKESSWSWKTLYTQHFTLNNNKRKLFGARNKFLISDGISFGSIATCSLMIYQDHEGVSFMSCHFTRENK